MKERILDCLCAAISSKGFTTLGELNLASMHLRVVSIL